MNSQLEKSEEQKVQGSASLCTDNVNHNDDMMINMISTINLSEAPGKIHLPIISGEIKMHYLRYSEEGCSRKSSSCSNNDFLRNPRFLAFG